MSEISDLAGIAIIGATTIYAVDKLTKNNKKKSKCKKKHSKK